MNFSKLKFLMISAAAAVILLVQTTASQAAELVMFEQEYCEWCEAWHDEIAAVYPLTDEGRLLPLRAIDIHDDRPTDLKAVRGVRFTPTFVVMEKGKEVGRILGYSDEAMFYWQLSEIIAKLSRKQAGLANDS